MKRIYTIIILLGLAPLLSFSEPQYTGKRPQIEVVERDGIGNVLDKIRAGGKINIVYFGGSITHMDGWRRLSFEWLTNKYPKASFSMTNAAIPGTDSGLGVFRCRDHVIAHDPDLVFIEFSVNDKPLTTPQIWENYDGIVRQIWQHNPKTDIICCYTTTESRLADNGKGLLNDTQTATDMVAEHYGIPSIAFGVRIAKEVNEGRMIPSLRGVKNVAPGKTLFAEDGVHPALPGHGFYLQAIQAFWQQAENLPPANHARHLARPFLNNRLDAAKLVPISPSMLRGNWQALPPSRFDAMIGRQWQASHPGDSLEFSFRGTDCKILDVMGPNGAYLKITVDGVQKTALTKRYDAYCTCSRLSEFPVFSGTNALHKVKIEVAKEIPDRREVLKRNPEADLSDPKFQGSALIVGRIQLLGNLAD